MLKHLIVILLTTVISIQVNAKSYTKDIDGLLNDFFDKDGSGGVALVVKDGKSIYRKAFGKADIELDVKMTPEHVFRIGSISKQFTAVAILKLVEEGKIKLDADISQYIKDYPTHGHQITIENLLQHTSGIKDYTSMPEFNKAFEKTDLSSEGLVNFFKNQAMDFKPGSAHQYSNSGYVLLGYIIEQVTGQSYAEYMQQNIFKPLKMNNSYYGSSTQIIKNRAKGYDRYNDKYHNAKYISMSLPYAAGSLLSTVDDLNLWNHAIMENKIISAESRKKAHDNSLINGKTIDYGYGWDIGQLQGTKLLKHNGGINGFYATTLSLPEEDVYVVLLTNCSCTTTSYIINKLAAIVIDKPYEWTAIKLDEETLQSYVGDYQSEGGGQRFIRFEEGQMFSLRGWDKYKIIPFEKDKFFFEKAPIEMHFNRNTRGEIETLTMKGTYSDSVWIKSIKNKD